MQAVFQARKQVHPIERDELDRITDIWIDAALRLEEKDLKTMARLVRSQARHHGGGESTLPAPAAQVLAATA